MLARLLGRADPGAPPGEAFARFETLRRARARRVQLYSRMAGRFFELHEPSAGRRDAALPGLPERLDWIHRHRAEHDVAAMAP